MYDTSAIQVSLANWSIPVAGGFHPGQRVEVDVVFTAREETTVSLLGCQYALRIDTAGREHFGVLDNHTFGKDVHFTAGRQRRYRFAFTVREGQAYAGEMALVMPRLRVYTAWGNAPDYTWEYFTEPLTVRAERGQRWFLGKRDVEGEWNLRADQYWLYFVLLVLAFVGLYNGGVLITFGIIAVLSLIALAMREATTRSFDPVGLEVHPEGDVAFLATLDFTDWRGAEIDARAYYGMREILTPSATPNVVLEESLLRRDTRLSEPILFKAPAGSTRKLTFDLRQPEPVFELVTDVVTLRPYFFLVLYLSGKEVTYAWPLETLRRGGEVAPTVSEEITPPNTDPLARG